MEGKRYPKHLPKLTAVLLVLMGVWCIQGPIRFYLSGRYRATKVFAAALRAVQTKAYEPVETQALLRGALRGVVAALDDPHAMYLEPTLRREVDQERAGRFGGIGIEVARRDELLVVVSAIEGTPAQKAGVKGGDVIVAINGQDCTGWPMAKAVGALRGQRGTEVAIRVRREGHETPLDFEITRDYIPRRAVWAGLVRPRVGYLRITDFKEKVEDEVEQELKQLEREKAAALVLDLRGNPGGYLDEAFRVCDQFLRKGLIVSTKGREGADEQTFEATEEATYASGPLAVLVDGGTASAAEVVAAALRDNGRAKLVGVKTFGKGAVVKMLPLPDGSAIILTSGRYYTPNGTFIEGVGLEPDVKVEFQPPTEAPEDAILDNQLRAAVELLEKDLPPQ